MLTPSLSLLAAQTRRSGAEGHGSAECQLLSPMVAKAVTEEGHLPLRQRHCRQSASLFGLRHRLSKTRQERSDFSALSGCFCAPRCQAPSLNGCLSYVCEARWRCQWSCCSEGEVDLVCRVSVSPCSVWLKNSVVSLSHVLLKYHDFMPGRCMVSVMDRV